MFNPQAVWHNQTLIPKQSFYEERTKSLEKFFLQLWKSDFDDFLQTTGNKCTQTNLQLHRLKQPTGLIFRMVLAAGLNGTNLENMVKCLYPCPDMRHFMIVTKKDHCFQTIKL